MITAIMVPLSERLVVFRLKDIYPDPDGIRFALDLYSIATLAFVIPLVGLAFVPNIATNGVAILYVAAFLINLLALILILTTSDIHRYVARQKFLAWTYPTWITLLAMVCAAAVSAILS